jgi:hypothetical protein
MSLRQEQDNDESVDLHDICFGCTQTDEIENVICVHFSNLKKDRLAIPIYLCFNAN